MNEIIVPGSYNYIAVFLTFRCSLGCSYCINNFEKPNYARGELSGREWISAVNRMKTRIDLPVTMQGGEPTLHKDFYGIVNGIDKGINLDLLTNLEFDIDDFMNKVPPERFKRDAKYASIRVSFHPEKMTISRLLPKVLKMQEAGYSIGIWGVPHPEYENKVMEAKAQAQASGIDFRLKEFLGEAGGRLYGTYKYAGACDRKFAKKAMCRTTEFIIGPDGSVYRCHFDLYTGKSPVGNVKDEKFRIRNEFLPCSYFGHCNPCDVKLKTNRFQEFGHTSVEIKDIE